MKWQADTRAISYRCYLLAKGMMYLNTQAFGLLVPRNLANYSLLQLRGRSYS